MHTISEGSCEKYHFNWYILVTVRVSQLHIFSSDIALFLERKANLMRRAVLSNLFFEITR